mmetsp:Transcript_50850/g.145311  ORF Transcript_50850/g.145311 Transcript_50850/m.145311 type:complete len:538 (-) Transcript_50850:93-1706(-)
MAAHAAELEAFFGGLPASRLTPHESALRQAIIDFAQARWPKAFPLSEWIDRRIGGEVEVRRTESGHDEVVLRQRGHEARDRDSFFAGLDPVVFLPEEDALRDAIFEFLARWKSRELATLADLTSDQRVQGHCAFLPADVTLKDWTEQRIGGEVEFKPDARGQEVIHLTPGARPFVTAKYEQLSGAGKGQGEARQQPTQNASSRDAFFAGLPAGELTPGEVALRAALLNYIEDWPRLSTQLGKPPGACPLLSDLGQDPQVQRSRAAFLPQYVPLKEWIDRRIGGEIELRKDDKGQFELWIRGTAPAKSRRAPSPRGVKREREAERRPAPAEFAEEFFVKLPNDVHTDAEAELRQAILEHLEGHEAPVQLSEACKDRKIAQCRSALLPPEVPLRLWIDRRVGGEVATSKDELGRYVLQIRGTGKAEGDPGPDREALKEQFFAELPPDGFTPDEEQLREALLEFLGLWKAKEPPTLSHAGGDAKVKKCRAKVLPKTTPVTLRDWIDKRIGGEIEMFEAPSGQLHFGKRGQLDTGAMPRRR